MDGDYFVCKGRTSLSKTVVDDRMRRLDLQDFKLKDSGEETVRLGYFFLGAMLMGMIALVMFGILQHK